MSTKHDAYYTRTTLWNVLKDQGRSQRWLARQTGRDESLLSKYRYGRRPIPRAFAEQAAALLALPVESLFSQPLLRADDTEAAAEEASHAGD